MRQTKLTRQEFDALPDYSCTVPTGVVIGKRWKRRNDYYDESKGWIIGQYIEDPEPGYARIQWTKPVIMDDVQTLIRDRLYS